MKDAPDALRVDDRKNDVDCRNQQHESQPDAIQAFAQRQSGHAKQGDAEKVLHQMIGLWVQPGKKPHGAGTVLPSCTATMVGQSRCIVGVHALQIDGTILNCSMYWSAIAHP